MRFHRADILPENRFEHVLHFLLAVIHLKIINNLPFHPQSIRQLQPFVRRFALHCLFMLLWLLVQVENEQKGIVDNILPTEKICMDRQVLDKCLLYLGWYRGSHEIQLFTGEEVLIFSILEILVVFIINHSGITVAFQVENNNRFIVLRPNTGHENVDILQVMWAIWGYHNQHPIYIDKQIAILSFNLIFEFNIVIEHIFELLKVLLGYHLQTILSWIRDNNLWAFLSHNFAGKLHVLCKILRNFLNLQLWMELLEECMLPNFYMALKSSLVRLYFILFGLCDIRSQVLNSLN